MNDLIPRKPPENSESNGDCRIKMCTGDVTDRVNHDHNN